MKLAGITMKDAKIARYTQFMCIKNEYKRPVLGVETNKTKEPGKGNQIDAKV